MDVVRNNGVITILTLQSQACLAKGTRLALYDGSEINVEDVKKGDLLLGPDGGPRKAFNIVDGKERLYRIKVAHSKDVLRVTPNHILALHRSKDGSNSYHGRSADDQRRAWEERFGRLPILDSEPGDPAQPRFKTHRVPDFITALKKAIVWMLDVDRSEKSQKSVRNVLNGTTAIKQMFLTYTVEFTAASGSREWYTFAWGNPSRETLKGHPNHPPVFYKSKEDAHAAAVAKSRELRRSGDETLYNLRERYLEKSTANTTRGSCRIDEAFPRMRLRWYSGGRNPYIAVTAVKDEVTHGRSFEFPGFPDEEFEDHIPEDDVPDVSVDDAYEYVEMTAADFAALNKYEKTKHRLYRPPPFEYPEQDVPVDPYFLGLWLGDGDRRATSIYSNHEQEVCDFLAAYAAELDLHFVHHGSLKYSIVGRTSVGRRPMPAAQAPSLPQKHRDEMVRRFTILGRRFDSGWKIVDEDGSGTATWHAPRDVLDMNVQSLLHDEQPIRSAYTTVKRPGNASVEQPRRRHRSTDVVADSEDLELFSRSSSLPVRQNVAAASEPEDDIYGATPVRQLPPEPVNRSSSSLPAFEDIGRVREPEEDIYGATPERQLSPETEVSPNARLLRKNIVAFTSDIVSDKVEPVVRVDEVYDSDVSGESVVDLTMTSSPKLPVVDLPPRRLVDLTVDSSQPESRTYEIIPDDPLFQLQSDTDFMSQIGDADIPVETVEESQFNQVFDMIGFDDDDAAGLDDVQSESEDDDEARDDGTQMRRSQQSRVRSGRRVYGDLDHDEQELLVEQIMPAQENRTSGVNTLLLEMDRLGLIHKGPKGAAGDKKHIPEAYMKNSRAVRLAVLAGLLDTDGSYKMGKHGNAMFVFAQSKRWHSRLFQDTAMLARSLGFTVSVSEYMSKPNHLVKTSNPVMRALITGDLKEIPTLLHRKIALERLHVPTRDCGIISIELEDEETEWYGFRVDKDQLYLRHDHLVLHNSGFEESMVSVLISVLIPRRRRRRRLESTQIRVDADSSRCRFESTSTRRVCVDSSSRPVDGRRLTHVD